MSQANLRAVLSLPAVNGNSPTSLSTSFEQLVQESADFAPVARILERVAVDEREVSPAVTAITDMNFDWIHDDVTRELAPLDREVFKKRWKAHAYRSQGARHSLNGFLGDLALAGRVPLNGEGVRVLTNHAVKGLEFRAVILVGMNDGISPDFRATSPAQKREELRNAYVAVTRATRLLVVTRPRTRVTAYGNIRVQDESPYVAWLGLSMEAR